MARNKRQEIASPRDIRLLVLKAHTELTEDDLYSEEHGLTAQQWQAVALLVAGRRQVDVAQELDVTPETLSRWKTLPTFTAALNGAVRDAYEASVGQVRESAREALDVLQDLLHSSDERVRLQAALHVVQLHLKLGENVHTLLVSPADVARSLVQKEESRRLFESFF